MLLNNSKHFQYRLLAVAIFLFSGCVNTKKRYEKAHITAEKRFLNELSIQLNGKEDSYYSANWAKAKTDLLWSNPEIIKAEFAIDDNIESRLNIWKSFIPSLSLSISDSQTFEDVSELFADTNLRVSSFFNFGNLLQMPKNLAVNHLTKLGLEWRAEQIMRNEVISLYRVFREKELLDLERDTLNIEYGIAKEITPDTSSNEYLTEEKSYKEALKVIIEKEQDWVIKVQELFMVPYSKIQLNSSDLPKINYKLSELDFSDTSRWGLLELNLFALEVLAEDQELVSAYLRYLPRPNISLSAPPLFSSNESRQFRLEEFRLSPSLNWSLDTTGAISSQIRRIKRNKPSEKWEADKRLASEVKMLLDGKKALKEVREELVDLRRLKSDYTTALKAGLIDEPHQALTRWKEFRQQEIALIAREVEICTSFWLIDDSKWKSTTTLWRELQVKRELRDKQIKKDKRKASLKKLFKKGSN